MSARGYLFLGLVVAGAALALPALAAPPTNTRDQILSRGNGVIGFSYWWGHGRWSTSSGAPHGSCSGGCPSCSHSGSYGADCSGFVAKAWQVPNAISVTTDAHPYSTYYLDNYSYHWSTISRGSIKKADAMVYNTNGAGHTFMFVSGDGWGWMTAIECKGCSYGCVKGSRTASSSYKAIRRDNVMDEPDKDGDGIGDSKDNCPSNKNTDQKDTDKDKKGNVCDTDDDGDGVVDTKDNCPLNSNANQKDTDGDKKGDTCDTDDDGDSVTDDKDNCPLVENKGQLDTDKDTKGNACDTDDDDDGLADGSDNCPTVANENQADTDEDGKGNACEDDDDDDGIVDASDTCPNLPNPEQLDTDKDGKGDDCDDDDDDDGIADGEDTCPTIASISDKNDKDNDGIGDVCDPDIDGDGIPNESDLCPRSSGWSSDDSDEDGVGDECDDDMDGDGAFNAVDNCPTISNPEQTLNADGKPEACADGDLGDPQVYVQETTLIPTGENEGCACATPRSSAPNSFAWLMSLGALALVLGRRIRK
jgi:MYXO-CTERM domain-containing protein